MKQTLLIVGLLLCSIMALFGQDPDQIRLYRSKNNSHVLVPVLKVDAFNARFGNNSEVPKNAQQLRVLSTRTYAQKDPIFIDGGCGEHVSGLIFAAKQNPNLSEADLVAVEADEDVPPLSLTYTSGHFKFFYITSSANPNDNVTLAQIQATAVIMNNAWIDFATNFKEPKHYVGGSIKLIDVLVYDLGPYLSGQTTSGWNHIELSSNQVVRDDCKRQTIPVHQLFHRVQYAYDYISGTPNLKWAVEATASWSQKYRAAAVGDWKPRMNSGLGNPDANLITNRFSDACHLWVYLGQCAGNERNAVKNTWATYQTNGKNMRNAVASTVNSMLPAGYFGAPKFEALIMSWIGANFLKDTPSPPALWDYAEDETSPSCGGTTHGPLGTTPRISANVIKGATYNANGSVNDYGADYFLFTLGSTVISTKLIITGSAATAKLTYFQAELVNGNMVSVNRGPLTGSANQILTRPVVGLPGTRQILVAVIGMGGSGSYNIKLAGL